MKPVVLYIDDHRDYQLRLSRRLRSLSGGAYEVVTLTVNDEREISSAVDALAHEIRRRITVSLCPGNLAVKPALDQLQALTLNVTLCEHEREKEIETRSNISRGHQAERDRDIRCDTRINNLERQKTIDILSISRFVRASQIDAKIRPYLVSDKPSHTSFSNRSNSIGTHLSFSHETGTRITRYVIGKEQARGHTVIYLPIKPLYQIEHCFRRGHGLTFGDLIYRFSVGDIPEIGDMGKWLYMHEDGFYTCSLPERSDDLITCEIGTLRQIINAWREYTRTRSQPTTSWIDMEGMPLSDVLALSVLCDFVYVDAPVGNSDKELVAQRELGLFLAKLPKECRILELPQRHQPLKEIDHISHGKESVIASGL